MEEIKGLRNGRGADVTIEATGVPAAVREGMQMTRDAGRYVIVGQYTDAGEIAINPHLDINKKHLEIRSSWGSDYSHFYKMVKVFARHVARVGDGPLLAAGGAHQRARVATAHRHRHVYHLAVERVERLRPVRRQVVADLLHRLDGPRVDAARGPRPGAVRLDDPGAVHARERLGHLAAVAVLDADEQDALHGQASFADRQQPRS